MKISELPQDIKELALEYERNSTYPGVKKDTDNIRRAFNWDETKEGCNFWEKWHKKEFEIFNKVEGLIEHFKSFEEPKTKPIQYQIGIDTFQRLEYNCSKEEILAFCKGNIDKYNWRKKGSDLEDFKKIIDYANFAIKQLEK